MGVEFKVKDELGNSNGQRNIKVCISCPGLEMSPGPTTPDPDYTWVSEGWWKKTATSFHKQFIFFKPIDFLPEMTK